MGTFVRLALAAALAAAATGCKLDDDVKAAFAPCHDCGTVAAIETLKRKGEGSGAGAFIGAVAGGVIGHQFGGGRGQDLATVAGAVGGGVAGHEIEKRRNSTVFYRVTVTMDEGGAARTLDVPELNGLAIGTKVKVIGETIRIASR